MNQLEMAKKAGLIEEPKSWDVLIKTLASYKTPKAQALYNKLNKRYNLKVDNSNKKGETNMSDEASQDTVETPSVPTETPTESTETTQA